MVSTDKTQQAESCAICVEALGEALAEPLWGSHVDGHTMWTAAPDGHPEKERARHAARAALAFMGRCRCEVERERAEVDRLRGLVHLADRKALHDSARIDAARADAESVKAQLAAIRERVERMPRGADKNALCWLARDTTQDDSDVSPDAPKAADTSEVAPSESVGLRACAHNNPTFIAGGRCGECIAETPSRSPFHPTTEEDWDLELVEEALTEAPDSAISNGARYWRRRFLKIVDRLGWKDVETAKREKEAARDEGAEAMRAACLEAVCAVVVREGLSQEFRRMFRHVIEGATP